MSKLFCLSPGLWVLERQMQEPPGYRPRGYGIYIIEEMDWKSRGNYSEIVDCVISWMQLEHLKKRVEEIFTEVDKEWGCQIPNKFLPVYIQGGTCTTLCDVSGAHADLGRHASAEVRFLMENDARAYTGFLMRM